MEGPSWRRENLIKPRTLYLDTAHWIDLAERRLDSVPLENAIVNGRVTPVVSLAHALDLAADGNEDRRGRVADYIDSLERVKWIRNYQHAFRREAIACFQALHDARAESPVEFFDSFHFMLPEADTEIIRIVGEGTPRRFSEFLRLLASQDEFQGFRNNECASYPHLRPTIVRKRSEQGAEKRFTEAEKRNWLAAHLPDEVAMSFGSVPVTDDLKERFFEQADLTLCPAFLANWAFHEGANLDPGTARPSDVVDLLHATGIAYCNVAFADRGTVERLRKGHYDRLPKRNSEFVGWIRECGKND